MNTSFLIKSDLPFCKGCGHHFIARNTAMALEKMGLQPLDVILVTDIGCHGIIDSAFATHTVHGLHGRSTAIAAGIAMGLEENKKIIVFLGDGGVTIGMQHLLEAARLNLDMTVIVHNNMLYGMTGGQNSGLTAAGYRTTTTPDGNPYPNYSICDIMRSAGAPYVARIVAKADFSEQLKEAFSVRGLSFVEILELCPSYGAKFNPGVSVTRMVEQMNIELGVWTQERGEPFKPTRRSCSRNLLETIEKWNPKESVAELNYNIILGGSAGGGVQKAAELLAMAAMDAGFHSSKKGSYPVTVGVGFSNAEIKISSKEILYHGITQPDVMLISSQDGLEYNARRLRVMKKGKVYVQEGLNPSVPEGIQVIRKNYLTLGERNINILMILDWLNDEKIIPAEYFIRRLDKAGILKPDQLEKLSTEFV